MTTSNEMWQGYAPEVKIGEGNPHAATYGKVWANEAYRKYAPGEELADLFLSVAKPKPGATVIDFGCGTGRGAHKLAKAGLDVTMIDFVGNSLDEQVRAAMNGNLRFKKHDIEKPIPCVAEYGYCTDVMEHIPEPRVLFVLENVLKAARHCFFSICTSEDDFGKLLSDGPLHLTIRPYSWWLDRLSKFDVVVEWSKVDGHSCYFYVSAWQDAQAIVDVGSVNTVAEEIKANVETNTAGDWMQVSPHETNEIEAMILGGGPSLDCFKDDIKQKRAEGVKLITLNGTYNWALQNGLIPSAQIIVDARPFNKRFVQPIVDGCKYLIASQCDPSVLEGLPKDRTYLWHTSAENIAEILRDNYGTYWGVPGGSTVLLRSLTLMRMLGYRRFHLYGCDSCILGADHHAYAQPENDGEAIIPVIVGGKVFYCNTWMVSQAQEFISTIKDFGDEIELEIYGPGLLAYILEHGANMFDEFQEQLNSAPVSER